MSYKKLILKSTAAIEIEEAISRYSAIKLSLGKKLEKEFKIAEKTHNFSGLYSTSSETQRMKENTFNKKCQFTAAHAYTVALTHYSQRRMRFRLHRG